MLGTFCHHQPTLAFPIFISTMTICVRISGEVCLDEVVTALSVHFKQEVGIGTENNDTADSIYVSLLDNAQSAIIAKDKKIKELEIAAENSLTSIQTFHNQQRTLFDEFVLLRQKYDEQKVALVTVLWSQCALHHPELRHIPSLESSDECQVHTTMPYCLCVFHHYHHLYVLLGK